MTGGKLDFKKEYKALYMPGTKPSIIDVPAMKFIMVDGKGDPNVEGGEYQQAAELLYALSYTIKMSKMDGSQPEGYFEYVVPPLEGLWWLGDNSRYEFFGDKDKFYWTSMIRQPEFVTQEAFNLACLKAARKKPQLDMSRARLQVFTEGLCVQAMHFGPYDDEPGTIAQMEAFINGNNYLNAISDVRPDGTVKRHHEIYLDDPRKVDPSKMKTVVRHPVKIRT